MKKWLPWVAVAVFAGWVLSTVRPKPETGFHTRDFGRLPVLLNGRIQPMDSVARNSLLQLRTKQTVRLEGKQTLTAIEWLLETVARPETADERKIFRIDNVEVLGMDGRSLLMLGMLVALAGLAFGLVALVQIKNLPTHKSMADISAGIYAAIGVLSALYARDAGGTGVGQLIDVSLVDAQTSWLGNIAGSYFADGKRPPRLGNSHPTVTPYQPVRAKDKMMIIAVGNDRLWQRFCALLGLESTLMVDPRFATNARRNENRAALIALIEQALVRRDAAAWIELFVKEGIPAGPINFPDETLNDAHIRARGMIVELEHPLIGVVRSLATPIGFARNGPTYRRPPPLLGQHSAEIRAELDKVDA